MALGCQFEVIKLSKLVVILVIKEFVFRKHYSGIYFIIRGHLGAVDSSRRLVEQQQKIKKFSGTQNKLQFVKTY